MKNLLDELNNLGEFEYSVSPEFGKNVMKKIKTKRRISKLKYVVSLASAACVLGICIFIANNSIKSSSIQSTNDFDKLAVSYSSTTDDSIIEEAKGNAVEDSASEPSIASESYNDSIDRIVFDTDELKTINKENIEASVKAEEKIPNQEFVKTFSYQEYLEDIIKTLSENGFVVEQKDDFIAVNSVDINKISELLKNYTQADISLESGQISIKIKK